MPALHKVFSLLKTGFFAVSAASAAAAASAVLAGCGTSQAPAKPPGESAIVAVPVAAEVWPVEVACTNPVYPPLQTMVRDPLRLREGHGRVAEVGDVLELVEVHSVDGRLTFDDGEQRLTTAGPGIGCVLTGMRPGEVRSFRVEEQGRTRESIRYEVRGFAGVPPRVRSRRLAAGGEAAGAPIASGDVVKVLRVIMIDGKRALTNESLEMTAYTEGFGALLLGMRLGDDVVFDVEGLEIKGAWLPAYDPNVRQHIEVELRVDQRVRTGADARVDRATRHLAR
jgi:hypothetical protein